MCLTQHNLSFSQHFPQGWMVYSSYTARFSQITNSATFGWIAKSSFHQDNVFWQQHPSLSKYPNQWLQPMKENFCQLVLLMLADEIIESCQKQGRPHIKKSRLPKQRHCRYRALKSPPHFDTKVLIWAHALSPSANKIQKGSHSSLTKSVKYLYSNKLRYTSGMVTPNQGAHYQDWLCHRGTAYTHGKLASPCCSIMLAQCTKVQTHLILRTIRSAYFLIWEGIPACVRSESHMARIFVASSPVMRYQAETKSCPVPCQNWPYNVSICMRDGNLSSMVAGTDVTAQYVQHSG